MSVKRGANTLALAPNSFAPASNSPARASESCALGQETVHITNRGSNTVSVINVATNTVIDTISVGSYPYRVSVSKFIKE